MRITDNAAMMRTPELASDQARNIRQTGLTAGTLNEIIRDTEDDLQQVQDKSEIEDGRVRTDAESESAANQEQPPREKEDNPPSDEDEALRRRAAEDLLNLPVTGKQETESRRFDIRV